MKKCHLKASFAIRAALVAAAVAVHSAFADTPDELLDYVQTDGSAYIDTGIIGKAGTKASIGMMWHNGGGTKDVCFLGARNGSNGRFLLCHAYSGNWNLAYRSYYTSSAVVTNPKPADDTFYSVQSEIDATGVYKITVNGKSYTHNPNSGDTGSWSSSFSMYLFALQGQTSGTASNKSPSGTRCYWTKIWQQDANGVYQLVRDFVPCKKGDRVGLWDRVSGNIVYPVTGTLTAGNTVAIHAEPDKELEYVEADGRQYIDTGVVGRDGTKAEIDFKFNELGNSSIILLGADDSDPWGDNNKFYLLAYRSVNGTITDGYKNRYNQTFAATTDRRQVISEVVVGGTFKTTMNGSTVTHDYSANPGPYNIGLSLYLFTNNRNGAAGALSARARCYGLKIEQTDSNGVYQVVRDFTPCMKDERAGLYDSVSGMIFFGQGADLIAPPDTEGVPDAFVEYVESDGTQCIDTGVIGKDGTKSTMTVEWTVPPPTDTQCDWCFLGSYGNGQMFYLFRWLKTNGYNPGIYSGYNGRWGIQGWRPPTDRPFEVISTVALDGTFTMQHSGTTKVWSDYTGNAPVDTGCNLYLFARDNAGTADNFTPGRCYRLKIEQVDSNGVWQVVRDFRPCIKNGIAGLYDDISKTIFYPAVGRLRAADKTLPAKFVEYVESDGSLYVDTCVKGKAGTKAEMTFNVNENNGNPSYLLSSYGNSVHMNFCYFGNSINVGFGGSDWDTFWSGYSKGTQYTLKSEYTLAKKVNASLNNDQASEKTATGGTNSGVNLYAFARNNAGMVDGRCSVKLYAMKILQADAVGTYSLVRDFKPCVATNGVAALYDKVSGTIFYPHGGLLATGGVERAVSVTARWKGGAVTTQADLAVAANWDCFDANGNLVADTTPTAVTTVLVGQGSPLLALPTGIAVQDWAGIKLTNSVTLSAACDWSPLGPMTLANGVTIDLAGHDLVSGGFTPASGATASVANSDAASTLTFAVADGTAATMNGITFASNLMLAKTGSGKLTTVGSAWSSITVSNGTLVVSAQSSTIDSVYLAKGAVLDLGGKAVTCGTFSGAGKVRNGSLVVTGTLSAVVGNPLTFSGVVLDVSGAGVAITNPESITGRDPIVVATSDQSITGRAHSVVSDRRAQVSQDGDVYKLELVPSCGFRIFLR